MHNARVSFGEICLLSSFQIPRILHPRLVHRREEADLSLLSREGGLKAHVSQPLGEAPHDVRPAAGLAALACLLAAHHPCPRAGDQLGPWLGIAAA